MKDSFHCFVNHTFFYYEYLLKDNVFPMCHVTITPHPNTLLKQKPLQSAPWTPKATTWVGKRSPLRSLDCRPTGTHPLGREHSWAGNISPLPSPSFHSDCLPHTPPFLPVSLLLCSPPCNLFQDFGSTTVKQ